jgi:hypothetical protein
MNSGNDCYHQLENILSYRILSEGRIIIKPVVLYGCETWFLTLLDKHMRCLGTRSKEMFGSKWVELTGLWRKLHNEEFRNFCSSPNITRMTKSRRVKWVGKIERTRKKGN